MSNTYLVHVKDNPRGGYITASIPIFGAELTAVTRTSLLDRVREYISDAVGDRGFDLNVKDS